MAAGGGDVYLYFYVIVARNSGPRPDGIMRLVVKLHVHKLHQIAMRDIMTMRSTHVSRGIKGLLALSLVLVLFPLCDMATAGDKNRVLILASMKGDVKKVISLLNSGVDVNVKDERGWTALMEAANRGHAKIGKLLMEKGGNVNMKHKYGWTALSIAAGRGNKEMELLLRARGAKQ